MVDALRPGSLGPINRVKEVTKHKEQARKRDQKKEREPPEEDADDSQDKPRKGGRIDDRA